MSIALEYNTSFSYITICLDNSLIDEKYQLYLQYLFLHQISRYNSFVE